jgi:hypothetical protein
MRGAAQPVPQPAINADAKARQNGTSDRFINDELARAPFNNYRQPRRFCKNPTSQELAKSNKRTRQHDAEPGSTEKDNYPCGGNQLSRQQLTRQNRYFVIPTAVSFDSRS